MIQLTHSPFGRNEMHGSLWRRLCHILRTHRIGIDDHSHDHDADQSAEDDVLAQYRAHAQDLHEELVHDHNVSVIEFLGATGSGKTTLIEGLIERASPEETIGVIVGDVAGDDDAQRYRTHDVTVNGVTTGKECHLDPGLMQDALTAFDLQALDTLYVENVGNMVCPADFPLGAQARILVVSTTEGDDVLRKHPLLVEACDLTVINKADLAPAVGADLDRMAADVNDIAPSMPVLRTTATEGTGLEALAERIDAIRLQDHHEEAGGHHAHSNTLEHD